MPPELDPSTPTIRFRILGALDVRADDGRPVPLRAPKLRTLLAVLLLHANQPVGADRLTELLWPAGAPRSAAGALRTYVSTLRTALGLDAQGRVRLVAAPPGYRLELPAEDLDALLFHRLAGSGRRAAVRGDYAAAAGRWKRALDLWQGAVLDGIEVDARGEAVRSDLTERRLGILEDWAESGLAVGGHAEVLPALRAACADQPTRERLHGLLMLALYRAGRQADALDEFRRLRDHLVTELGVEPGPALQRLQRQILVADPALDAPGGAVTIGSAPAAVPRQLPPDVPSLVGRLTELAAVRGVGDGPTWTAGGGGSGGARPGPRMVAIDGPGGVGKSTLAIHAAHRLAASYPDGQLYVDLQGATAGLPPLEPLEVLGRFHRALGGRERAPASVAELSASFRASTAGSRLLVLLDNVRDSAQVRPLLPGGADCMVLVTSRQVLTTLDGAEHVHVTALSEADAVLLLSGLAGRARIAADPDSALRVARWCGCLPLALRIAGARLAARPSWPVRALADRLSDARRRLDELTAADLAVRSTFQVSHQILDGSVDPVDRAAVRAFARAGLPDGPDLSLPAAAALLDLPEPAAEQAMERLVDCQLAESPWPGRYRLHDLLRLFARERAAEGPASDRTAALDGLLRWYVASVWQAFRVLRPGDPRSATAGTPVGGGRPFATVDDALAWLEAERGNLVAAVQQVAAASELAGELATELARALFAFFHIRGHVGDWIDANEAARRVARRDGDRLAEAYACKDLGAARELRGQYRDALADLRDGLALFTEIGDNTGRSACLNNLGAVYDSLGEPARAARLLEESLAISRELADRHSQAISLNNLGPLYDRLGDPARALSCLGEARATFAALGNRRGQAVAMAHLAGVHAVSGRHAQAMAYGRSSLAIFEEIDDASGRAYALSRLGVAHRVNERYSAAASCLREARQLAERVGDGRLAGTCLKELGVVATQRGDPEEARRRWREALVVFDRLGIADAGEVRALLAAAHADSR
jgi:DNA-binding SARP family transcriptional activator